MQEDTSCTPCVYPSTGQPCTLRFQLLVHRFMHTLSTMPSDTIHTRQPGVLPHETFGDCERHRHKAWTLILKLLYWQGGARLNSRPLGGPVHPWLWWGFSTRWGAWWKTKHACHGSAHQRTAMPLSQWLLLVSRHAARMPDMVGETRMLEYQHTRTLRAAKRRCFRYPVCHGEHGMTRTAVFGCQSMSVDSNLKALYWVAIRSCSDKPSRLDGLRPSPADTKSVGALPRFPMKDHRNLYVATFIPHAYHIIGMVSGIAWPYITALFELHAVSTKLDGPT